MVSLEHPEHGGYPIQYFSKNTDANRQVSTDVSGYTKADSFMWANFHVEYTPLAHYSPESQKVQALHDTVPSTDQGPLNVHLKLQ